MFGNTQHVTLLIDDQWCLTVKDKIGVKGFCTVAKDRYPFQRGDKIVKVSGCCVKGLDADSLFQFMLIQNKPYTVEVVRYTRCGQPTFANPLYEPTDNRGKNDSSNIP